MVQQKEYLIFRSNQRKSQLAVKCRACSSFALLRSFLVDSLLPLWLSYGALEWIRSAFESSEIYAVN